MPYSASRDYRNSQRNDEMVPARRAIAVVPSDTVDLILYAKSFYVGSIGDIAFVPLGQVADTAIVLKAHPIGYSQVAARRIYATGTTATNIVAFS